MEVDGNNITWFTYTGEEDIPDDATHIFIRVRVVPEAAFSGHPSIVEVICHEDVEKIEEDAFVDCSRLRRVIMPGVLFVENGAFTYCEALMHVECDKLEIIEGNAFFGCTSLSSIDLPSVKIIGEKAFDDCAVLKYAKFGDKLETIEDRAFIDCPSLERITIPLKDGIITADEIFAECIKLNHIDLADGELHETIDALHLEDWKNDMNDKIDSINRILPNTSAARYNYFTDETDFGEKGLVIRRWIRSVLRKITDYKAEHQLLLSKAANTLQLVLPNDIVMNNVLPFLDLPSYTFEVENHDDGEDSDTV